MTAEKPRDPNPDHPAGTKLYPVRTGLAATGGAVAGSAVGALFGPIGMLVGGAVGAIGGAVAVHIPPERVDPDLEAEYWRNHYKSRPYYKPRFDYDTDYAPAYAYGSEARARSGDHKWDDSLEDELRMGWANARGKSHLTWEVARDAVRDAWDRDDLTYRTYSAVDRYYAERFAASTHKPEHTFDIDYRPAYRYGTWARSHYADREWDETLEADLERGWPKAKGNSSLAWAEARDPVRDAWRGLESIAPQDVERARH